MQLICAFNRVEVRQANVVIFFHNRRVNRWPLQHLRASLDELSKFPIGVIL